MAIPSLIGVIHLPPLGGAPGAHGLSLSQALSRAGLLAVREANLLAQAGFGGIILENFGDVPFYKNQVPPETIAQMAVISAAVREATKLPIGINVLRNDGRAALAIAAATGAQFIRVNILSGVAATDQGMIEGDAAFLLRERDRLGANIEILADAHVKHAKSLSSEQIELAVEEVALRSLASGVILTGATTGRSVDPDQLRLAAKLAAHHGIRIWIGSGATLDNLADLKHHVHGVIVGSALRRGSRAGAPLELKRARLFAQAFRSKPARSKRRK